MKNKGQKSFCVALLLGALVFTSGFTSSNFSIASLKHYEREFKSESIGACATSSTKTYEDYRAITAVNSKQYQHIHNHMSVDETTGLLYDEDGFIGVALGYQFGDIGSRYYFVLDTGIILPVVKVDAKATVDATNGCSVDINGSVLEFVIDSNKAFAYFGGGNGLANNGNFNNYDGLKGNILDVERVLDEKVEEGIIYETELTDPIKGEVSIDQVTMVEGGY